MRSCTLFTRNETWNIKMYVADCEEKYYVLSKRRQWFSYCWSLRKCLEDWPDSNIHLCRTDLWTVIFLGSFLRSRCQENQNTYRGVCLIEITLFESVVSGQEGRVYLKRYSFCHFLNNVNCKAVDINDHISSLFHSM